jgi:acetyltransferase
VKILDGVRGEPPVDRAALEDVVLRVGQLVTRHQRIGELDLNPVIAREKGSPTFIADARISVAAAPPASP